MNTLEINEVTKVYDRTVLDEVNLKLESGKVYGLLGPNGSGKSTLMKIICALVKPTYGNVAFNARTRKESGLKIGYMIEDPVFYKDMTGYQNLKLLSTLYNNVNEERIQTILKFTGLITHQNEKYGNYSMGMKKRFYFGLALLNSPDILILDEPFNGIDPLTSDFFEKEIKAIAEKGRIVLISSHEIRDLSVIIDEAFFLRSGKIIYDEKEPRGKDLMKMYISLFTGADVTEVF